MTENKSTWSWGGAMFPIIYLVLSRKLVVAILVSIAMFIPFLNLLVVVVMFVVGGLKGKQWLESDDSLSETLAETYNTFLERVGKFAFWMIISVLVLWTIMMLGFRSRTTRWMGTQQGMEFMNIMENLEGFENMESLSDLEDIMAELENIEANLE